MKERILDLLERECEKQNKYWDESISVKTILDNKEREEFLETCSEYEEFHYWDFEKLDDDKWLLTVCRN